MTAAKAMKSPGQKLKTPKKEPGTPKMNAKGAATPNGTPYQKTPKKPASNANGTPKAKSPNGSSNPKAKSNVSTPLIKTSIKSGTPTAKPAKQSSGKLDTPKAQNVNAAITPKAKAISKPTTPKPPLNTKSPRKRRASEADETKIAKVVGLSVRIFNLPAMPEASLKDELKKLFETRGDIQKLEFYKGNARITFSKPEEARAAKKLNGVVLSGKHLSIVHHDDKDLPRDNRVVVTNVPNKFSDEDVFSLFSSCGKIVSIHMNREWRTKNVQRCYITFDNKKAADSAISSEKNIRGKQLVVKAADGNLKRGSFDPERTVFISGLSPDVSVDDVIKFVSKVCSVSDAVIIEAKKRYAIVLVKNESDVGKALALNGQTLQEKQISTSRSKKSVHYVKPVQMTSESSKSEKKAKTAKKEVNYPPEKTIVLFNVSSDATVGDVTSFVSKVCPVSHVGSHAQKIQKNPKEKFDRSIILVCLTSEGNVEKALTLHGKNLKGQKVRVERSKLSKLYTKSNDTEVPAKKQKKNDASTNIKAELESEEEDVDDSDVDMSDSEGDDVDMKDLLATFKGKMQKLKSSKVSKADDEEEEDDDDDEEEEDDDDDDGEEEEEEDDDDDDDDDDEEEDDDDDDDEEDEDDDEEDDDDDE